MKSTSRRDFLNGLVVAGGAAVLQSSRFAPQAGPAAARRIIDVHHHIMPPKYVAEHRDEQLKMGPGNTGIFNWTPKVSIDQMDASGVGTSIISLSTPGTWFGRVAEGRRLSREVNEYAATMVRDYPGRFGMFGAIPLPDTEGSLKEIEYALDVLKADGIGLMTSYDTTPLGVEQFAPVFDELNRRRAIVFIHRTASTCCWNLRQVPGNVEFIIDDFRSLNSLLASGTFVRCPNIRFIWAHGEQIVPWLNHTSANSNNPNPAYAPQGVTQQLKKIYIDTAGNRASEMSDLREMGMLGDHVMFGTDVPYGNVADNVKNLRTQMGLSPAEITAIEYGTAEQLFPKFRGTNR